MQTLLDYFKNTLVGKQIKLREVTLFGIKDITRFAFDSEEYIKSKMPYGIKNIKTVTKTITGISRNVEFGEVFINIQHNGAEIVQALQITIEDFHNIKIH